EVLLELLRSEAATLGSAAALARYDDYRTGLRDELGSDPGSALKAVHRELLQAEAPVVRQGVTHEPNRLLGRDADLQAVTDLLHTSRVTSIVGPGGLGKTRLAHAVGRAADQRLVQFVALAGVTAEKDVAAEVAGALGVREKPGTELVAGIVSALTGRSTLLVLDNCEHVLDGVAELVGALVSMAPETRVLTTSRAPLGLSSETVYALPELDLATAVELFAQRARAARPNAELPAAAVEEVCRHLDGLPLAVELAAARIRVMSVAEFARNLDDRFSLLRGGSRDAPARHRTLQAVVDWSWNLLDEDSRAALRALSVFPGGFTAEAARHLLGPGAIDTLEQLTEQSLLRTRDSITGVRFGMLETVREFCAARRAIDGESPRAVEGFLAWVRALAAARHLDGLGPQPFAFTAAMRDEQDNLLLALRMGLERGDGATLASATALLAGMWTVDTNHARISRLTAEVDTMLSHYRPEPEYVDVTRAAVTLCLANTLLVTGPGPDRSLATLRRLPAPVDGQGLGAIALIIRDIGLYLGPDRAPIRELCDSPDRHLAGGARGIYSYLVEADGDAEGAMAAARRMLSAFDPVADPWMRCMAHGRISDLCLQQDRPEEARDQLEAAMRIMESLGEWTDQVGVRWGLVLANLQLGDVDAAEDWM
ncbi:MAG TPA: AAA family ATPase, partial [Phytomonospora sp.]